MNDSKLYFELDFPVKFIKDDVFYHTQREDIGGKRPFTRDYLTNEAMEFLESIGLKLTPRFLFLGFPELGYNEIHVDYGEPRPLEGQIFPRFWAINYPLVSKEVDTIWYKRKSENINEIYICPHKGKIEKYTPDEVEEIARTRLTGPTLIRTDVPHQVRNYSNTEISWRISLRGNQFGSWEEAVEFLKPWFKNPN